MAALRAAGSAFARVYQDPSTTVLPEASDVRVSAYELLKAYYYNNVFEQVDRWIGYKQSYGLYRHTRSIYNPTKRLVDFYAGSVYPGVLSEDGARLPDGVPLAIPLAEDTNPQLKSAIAQLWQWTNWQADNHVMVRYGAMTGDCFIEVMDDLDRQKVSLQVWWPGHLKALKADPAGNVKGYVLEYRTVDEKGEQFTYRKEADEEAFRFFRDDKPWSPDEGGQTEFENFYGFVPAVKVSHRDIGGDWGEPAMAGSLGKVDELNSVASAIDDHMLKSVRTSYLVGSSADIREQGTETKKATNDVGMGIADRESARLYLADPGATVTPMVAPMNYTDSEVRVQSLITEIERDHPELSLYAELRSMQQVTGPGAARMLGDVAGPFYEATANYDRASIALFQMAVAIGGERLQRGDWPDRTRQREKFNGFNLESYAAGDLDFAIMPRPLVTPTELERIEVEMARLNLDAQRGAGSAFVADQARQGVVPPQQTADIEAQAAGAVFAGPEVAQSA